MAEVLLAGIFALVPERVIGALVEAAEGLKSPLYLCGGAVRDLLLGRPPLDLDFTTARAGELSRLLARTLPATLVVLDEEEQAWRMVWKGRDLDITGMRDPSAEIVDDLKLRDFTINAMAVRIDQESLARGSGELIDPCGGEGDLAAGVVRMVSTKAFADDPLRRLRAFRFAACLDLVVDDRTMAELSRQEGSLAKVARERVDHELELIMACGRAGPTFEQMRDNAVLAEIIPELIVGRGVKQPASHHLDVLDHGLAALCAIEEVNRDPARWYPDSGHDFYKWLSRGNNRRNLCWAALLHDIGKPLSRGMKGERITFYNHDQAGAREVAKIAGRLRWSRKQREQVARLVRLHMWPFHLNNARRKTGIRPRACLKIYRAAGDDLAGLFLLAMADSIAGRGPGRPETMEADLAELYREVIGVVRERISPLHKRPPLLTGHDLKDMGIAPGPIYKKILEAIFAAQVNGELTSPEEAAAFVETFLSGSGQS